jgi:uncharacterized Ntn-hydrolase superfamily protein
MTYSIVARDPGTGELAVAVQSHYFGVGRLCPFVRAGVGAVATQASVDPSYGPLGLQLMEAGKSPAEALAGLVAADSGSAIRQVAMIDATGRVAAHTGDTTIAEASHLVGDQFSVQANMMTSAGVPEAMAAAFTSATGHLADRILSAFDAAEEAGGDIRGRQSAALLVTTGERGGLSGVDRTWDLRVDDHPEPLQELRRLVRVKRGYDGAFLGANATSETIEAALTDVEEATGGNPEMTFWAALTLARIGRMDEARDLLRRCAEVDERWPELLRRLPRTGNIDQPTVDALLAD